LFSQKTGAKTETSLLLFTFVYTPAEMFATCPTEVITYEQRRKLSVC